MATTNAPANRIVTSTRLFEKVRRPSWSLEAWGSIAAVAIFLGITFWWLSQNRSIPVFDAGLHLSLAIDVYEEMGRGNIGQALTLSIPYPPFTYLVGSLGLWIGGIAVAPPVVAQNLVFVPLLALGCYNVGRLAFGRLAGLLAVVAALGSPLITAQFHVPMTDAPETAMVAVAVWLILESERFSRIGISAAAGVAVGLGMVTKEPFAFFVAGVLLVTVARGGWRAWRGLAVFAVVALAIALPWYIHYFSQLKELASSASVAAQPGTYSGIAPPRFSGANLTWYFWNIVNNQLYLPLFAFALVGGAWTIVGLTRRRSISPFDWELTIGAFVAWFAITETYVHDTRYSMPLLLYLAVFAGGWIVRLKRPRRLMASGALVLIAIANTLAISFGVGGFLHLTLPGAEPELLQAPGIVTLYSKNAFVVGKPYRDGEVLKLMRELRRGGTQRIALISLGVHAEPPSVTADFSEGGLDAFAQIAKLEVLEPGLLSKVSATDAFLAHGPVESSSAPPCVTLSDGTGVWVWFGDPVTPGTKVYCPYRQPAFYAPVMYSEERGIWIGA
jgi:hypothetical protein